MIASLSFAFVVSDPGADPRWSALESMGFRPVFGSLDSAFTEPSPELRALSLDWEAAPDAPSSSELDGIRHGAAEAGSLELMATAGEISFGSGQAAADISGVWLGTSGNDRYTLEAGVVTAYGGLGQDILTGTGGADTIFGGAGRDTIITGDGADVIEGGAGHDRILATTDDVQRDGDKLLRGNDGNDELHGGRGDDMLYGGSGRDALVGHKGADSISGGGGHDKLFGEKGKDELTGGTGDDTLYGGRGRDTLKGDSGDDILVDERLDGATTSGSDVYFGGVGADHFIFRSAHMGRDRIEDFKFGEDVLDLRAVADALTAISDTAQVKITDTAAGVVFKVDANNKVLVVGADLGDFQPGDYLIDL